MRRADLELFCCLLMAIYEEHCRRAVLGHVHVARLRMDCEHRRRLEARVELASLGGPLGWVIVLGIALRPTTHQPRTNQVPIDEYEESAAAPALHPVDEDTLDCADGRMRVRGYSQCWATADLWDGYEVSPSYQEISLTILQAHHPAELRRSRIGVA